MQLIKITLLSLGLLGTSVALAAPGGDHQRADDSSKKHAQRHEDAKHGKQHQKHAERHARSTRDHRGRQHHRHADQHRHHNKHRRHARRHEQHRGHRGRHNRSGYWAHEVHRQHANHRHCRHRSHTSDYRGHGRHNHYSEHHARDVAWRRFGLRDSRVHYSDGHWVVYGFSASYGPLRVLIDSATGLLVSYHAHTRHH